LAFVARGETGMAALGTERYPAVFGWNESRHTQAAAGADQSQHAALGWAAAADLAALLRQQLRQRHRQRREVVDHHEVVELQALAHLLDGELPVVIRYAHVVAGDHVRMT